jgi:DHA2 family multidrug resistance protein
MVDHLTPYDPMYALRAQQGATLLQQKGIDPSSANHGGLGIMYENMIRQAAMLSFADVFYLLTWMMIILIPLVLFMKNSTSKGKIQPGSD